MKPWNKLSLWQTQKDALDVCARYFDSPEEAALVQMPTGAGKTGVIAVISAIRSEVGPVIVLAPSEALVHQLKEKISTGFWATIVAPSSWPPKDVHVLLPSAEKDVSALLRKIRGRTVIVSTFQALQQVRQQKPGLFDLLKSRIKTILIDEGHREPALSWARTVREFGKPTVLFSATPYRNDQRLFNVSEKFVYFLSFDDGLQKHCIRDVQFINLKSSESSDDFADAVIRAVNGLISKDVIAKDSKVIIHANNEARVTALHHAFTKLLHGTNEQCVAFHETFDGRVTGLLPTVPDLTQRQERYYIHQYKLIEGLDEPKFSVFVPYDDFTNARQLVQQIGRIIRNPTPYRKAQHTAVILQPKWSHSSQHWSDYRKFDKECEVRGTPSIKTTDFISQYLKTLPSLDYVNRRFAKRADFDNPKIFEELLIPRSCVIYSVEPGFSIPPSLPEIRKCIELDDRVVIKDQFYSAQKCYIAISITTNSSTFLAESFFPEFSLQLTVIRNDGRYLYCTDTGGLWLDELDGIASRVATNKLQKLFPERAGTRISSISARNSDIGPTAIRSRSISARSLDDAAPFMGDYLHVIAHARGRTTTGSRYVGFSRGRVRDEYLGSSTLIEYCHWTSALGVELDGNHRVARYLSRFSTPAAPPANTNPRNILLDVDSVEGDFQRSDGITPSIIEDLCIDVAPHQPGQAGPSSWTISLPVSGGSVETVNIMYEHNRARYKLQSPFLDSFKDKLNKKTTLLSRINQNQAFRILCASNGYIYSSGEFFRISEEVGLENLRTAVQELLTPIPALSAIQTEKGNGVGNHNNWALDSLFRYIDQQVRANQGAFGSTFEEVVCDDLNDEVADFVALTQAGDGKVVFIHAKADSPAAGAGASKLYEVCGQAMKNLVYLRHGARQIPSPIPKWDRPWRVDAYQVSPRIRNQTATSAQLRQTLANLLDKPKTQREMWIVLGRILSQGTLDTNLQKRSPDYYAIQAAYLLMSADAACKSVGVTLRVFCAP